MRSGARPSSALVPIVQVTGRSVLSRSVKQGTREVRALLLDAAGVGQHAGRALEKAQEPQVAERREDPDGGGRAHVLATHGRAVRGCIGNTTGMSRAMRSSVAIASPAAGRPRARGRWSVTSRYPPRGRSCALARLRSRMRGRIATSVSIIVLPTAWMRLVRAAFVAEVVARLGRVDEQEIRHLVRDDPVDLLGHRAVERAEARLDVPHGDRELGGGERCRHRRVDVSRDEHDVGTLGFEDRLEALHHPSGLHRVRSRSDAENVIGLADAELLEEDPRHRVVVVLSRVDQRVPDRPRASGERGDDRRGLHEVGTRADDRDHVVDRSHGGHGRCRSSGFARSC